MNKAELTALRLIANKLGWNGKPVVEVIPTIRQMVINRQNHDLDCFMDYDGFEETLLSMALWDANRIISSLYVYDYISCREYYRLLEHLCVEGMDLHSILTEADEVQKYSDRCWIYSDEEAEAEEEYWKAMYEEWLLEQQLYYC